MEPVRSNSRWLLGFLIAVLVSSLEAKVLSSIESATERVQCACNVGHGRCRANKTCVPSTSHGHCVRFRINNSLSEPTSRTFLTCADDDSGLCQQKGAYCCRDGHLCNLLPKEISEEVLQQRQGGSYDRARSRRLRRSPSFIDLFRSPDPAPPARGPLRCLCREPPTNTPTIRSPSCRMSKHNRSICVMKNGGYCARSWHSVDGSDEKAVQDFCIPNGVMAQLLCDPTVVLCCSDRNLCQSSLHNGLWDHSVQPATRTLPYPPTVIASTAPPSSQHSLAQSEPIGDWNSTWSAREPLRCLCNTQDCDLSKGWCETDGLCYSYKSPKTKVMACVNAGDAPSYSELCREGSDNICCKDHCCNDDAVINASQVLSCRLGAPVLPNELAASEENALGNTTLRPTVSTPATPDAPFARTCHCSSCPDGYCTATSGVCAIEAFYDAVPSLHRSCVPQQSLRQYCRTKSPQRVRMLNRKASFTEDDPYPIHCCTTDDCNECHPGYPKAPCAVDRIKCNCSTCGDSPTCVAPLRGQCYLDETNTISHCVNESFPEALCKRGKCCSSKMCNVQEDATNVTTEEPETKISKGQHPSPPSSTPGGLRGDVTTVPGDGIDEGATDEDAFPMPVIVATAAAGFVILVTACVTAAIVMKYHRCKDTKAAHQYASGKKPAPTQAPQQHPQGHTGSYRQLPNPCLSSSTCEKSDSHSNTSSTIAEAFNLASPSI